MLVARNGALKSNPDRNIRIAGEIEEDLEPEAQRKPSRAVVQRGNCGCLVDRVQNLADRVAQSDLFDEAGHDEGYAQCAALFPVVGKRIAAELSNLWNRFRCYYDRTYSTWISSSLDSLPQRSNSSFT